MPFYLNQPVSSLTTLHNSVTTRDSAMSAYAGRCFIVRVLSELNPPPPPQQDKSGVIPREKFIATMARFLGNDRDKAAAGWPILLSTVNWVPSP